jgi:hypothetical protein
MLVDAYLTYQFIKKLVTPFNKMKAFELGLIDENGNFLRRRIDFTPEDKRALGLFDVLIINLKKLIAKLPAGSTRLGTIAAAMYLLKSDPKRRLKEETINDELFQLEKSFNQILEEVKMAINEEGEGVPANNISGGFIKGTSPNDLKVPPAARKKYVKTNASDTLNLIRRINMMKKQTLQK